MLEPPSKLPAIADVYAVFEELTLAARVHFGGAAGGLLVLYGLADEAGAAVALGASIAGAAALGVHSDAERLKLAMRNGVCDFSVNHLDEALRILKNEIRKKTPVSVGLVGSVEMLVAEMLARGVQPDFVAASMNQRAAFVARGSRVLGGGGASNAELEQCWWSAAESPVRWLPVVDSLAAQALDVGSHHGTEIDRDARLRWLREVPRYLLRGSEHYLKMSKAEGVNFTGLVDAARASGAIAVPVKIRRESSTGSSEA